MSPNSVTRRPWQISSHRSGYAAPTISQQGTTSKPMSLTDVFSLAASTYSCSGFPSQTKIFIGNVGLLKVDEGFDFIFNTVWTYVRPPSLSSTRHSLTRPGHTAESRRRSTSLQGPTAHLATSRRNWDAHDMSSVLALSWVLGP
ncbi:hypothetical protein BDZ89DRAFT_398745 [Hymenopellis radicata]|nr:hypothetical protein BDZ89DRAFT_398745 [Hymenopellis radicata]